MAKKVLGQHKIYLAIGFSRCKVILDTPETTMTDPELAALLNVPHVQRPTLVCLEAAATLLTCTLVLAIWLAAWVELPQ